MSQKVIFIVFIQNSSQSLKNFLCEKPTTSRVAPKNCYDIKLFQAKPDSGQESRKPNRGKYVYIHVHTVAYIKCTSFLKKHCIEEFLLQYRMYKNSYLPHTDCNTIDFLFVDIERLFKVQEMFSLNCKSKVPILIFFSSLRSKVLC